MYLDDKTMAAMTTLQVDLESVAQIAGLDGIARVHAAIKGILTDLTGGVQSLSAVDREMAVKLGTDLHELVVQRAKEAHRERLVASLPADDLAACRLGGWDPAEYAGQKREAEAELTALSFTVRSDLSKRCGGNLVTMALQAKREGLL